MSLIYRAIWNDRDHNAVRVLDDEFKSWCQSKGIDSDDLPRRGRLEVADKVIDVRRGDAEVGQVLRVSLREPGEFGRIWTTTATASFTSVDGGTYWVDVECETLVGDRVPIAAPRLVRQILTEPGAPQQGPVALSERPFVAVGGAAGEDVASLVLNQTRTIPVAIFSPDDKVPVDVNNERASRAARTLAGIAAVHVLSPAACDAFNRSLAQGFRVYGGAVRLYLPGVDLSDESNAVLHRFFPVYAFDRSPTRAGQLMAAQLASARSWPDPPPAWQSFRPLILRPSEAEIAVRLSEIVLERPDVGVGGVDSLRDEIRELRELLVLAEAERDGISTELTAERDRYRRRVEELESEHIDDIAELEDRDLLNAALRHALRDLTTHSEGDAHPTTESPTEPDPADLTPSTAIRFARERLPYVAIHPEAEQKVDELDEAYKARPWGYTTWCGLVALNGYAAEVARGADAANFKTWCTKTGVFSHRKVAISESTSVKSGALALNRVLPISTDVDLGGKVQMLWHLKIQEGGGMNIPRLYFHDDTRGTTGMIHVGFYGPHYLMPNTKTN